MSNFASDSYNTTLTELKGIDRVIQNDIKEFKINSSTSVNTFNIENSIRKNLENYFTKLNKLKDEYDNNSNNIKKNIPDREFNRRLNEIQDLFTNYYKNKSTYDGILDIKYGYKSNLDNYAKPYEADEKTKNMSNQQLYEHSKNKLKDQDNQVDELIGYTKKGKELGNELKTELNKQNLLLEDVEKDVDKVQGRMSKTTSKFEHYVQSSSTCCIMTIVILELISLICIILFW